MFKIVILDLDDFSLRFLYDFESHFFGITIFGYVFKLYYFNKFFEVTFGKNNWGKIFVLSSYKRYL